MTKFGALVGIAGGIVALCSAIILFTQYFERLNGRVNQLEEQIRSLTSTATMTDRLNGRIGQLEEQMRPLVASPSAAMVASDRLGGRVNRLEEQVHSLAASSAAMAAAINEVSRKTVAVDPVMQKCVELAEEVNTGQRNTSFGIASGSDVVRNALVTMEKLGCNSKRP